MTYSILSTEFFYNRWLVKLVILFKPHYPGYGIIVCDEWVSKKDCHQKQWQRKKKKKSERDKKTEKREKREWRENKER